MSNDDVFSLISDIFGIAGRYTPETFRATRGHVEKAFQGQDQRGLLKIIESLELLVAEKARSPVPAEPIEVANDEVELKEVAAILQDPAFMPRKADLLAFLNRVIGKESLKANSKDSRDAVVRKAVNVFPHLPLKLQARVYKSLHARFVNARGSSLKDWSDIIAE